MSTIDVRAEMPGTIATIDCSPGQRVDQDATLLAIESMKMEYPVVAPRAGAVARIAVAVGDVVDEGALLLTLEP